jgi:hypothetical protein
MPDYVKTAAAAIRPGMSVFYSLRVDGWLERMGVHGVVVETEKTGVSEVKVTVKDPQGVVLEHALDSMALVWIDLESLVRDFDEAAVGDSLGGAAG